MASPLKRYVKFYNDPAQATAEHLANAFYSDLGLGAPKSQLFTHGSQTAYASAFVEGKTFAQIGVSKENAVKFLDGFLADVLTLNWDAVGLMKDNAFATDDGRVMRIDSGGSFIFRAKNGRKAPHLLDELTEIEGFFNPSLNPSYREVAEAAGIKKAAAFARSWSSKSKRSKRCANAGGWSAYVDRVVGAGMPPADRVRCRRMTLGGGRYYGLASHLARAPTDGPSVRLAVCVHAPTSRARRRMARPWRG